MQAWLGLAMMGDWRRLAPGNCTDNQEGLDALADRVGDGHVGWFKRKVLLARKESHEIASPGGDVIADRASQDGVARFERVQNRTLRHRRSHDEFDFVTHSGEDPQVCREEDANHPSVCTSTDTTGGRFCAIAIHESPASAEAYTCPPVVPKYTPQRSSESTAMASRSTFT